MSAGSQGGARDGSSYQQPRSNMRRDQPGSVRSGTTGAGAEPSPKGRPTTEKAPRTGFDSRQPGPSMLPMQGAYPNSYLRMPSPRIDPNVPFMQSPHVVPSMVGDPYAAAYLIAAPGPLPPSMAGPSKFGNPNRPSRGRGRSNSHGSSTKRTGDALLGEQKIPDMSGLSIQEVSGLPPFGISSSPRGFPRDIGPNAQLGNGVSDAVAFVHLPAAAMQHPGPGGLPLAPPAFWDEELTLAGGPEHVMQVGFAAYGPSPGMIPSSGVPFFGPATYGPGYAAPPGPSFRGTGEAYSSQFAGYDASVMGIAPEAVYSPRVGYQGFSRTGSNHRSRPAFTRASDIEGRPPPARPAYGDLYRPPRSTDRLSSAAMTTTAGGGNGGPGTEPVKPRSQLLDEYRSGTTANISLSELEGHIVEFSSDQHGSRLIQRKLEEATPEEKEQIFEELRPHVIELMTDVFGNYVIQKVFEHGTEEQRTVLYDMLTGKVLNLTLQMYGCRAIQKAVETLKGDQQKGIVAELKGNVIRCVKDQNGNHVIQKCVECVQPDEIQFIVDAFRGSACQLSMHPYGCRVVQRILEHGSDAQVDQVMDELHPFTFDLVQDQYGNYVIQHILERGRQIDKDKVINSVLGNVLYMSQHKFASNVVEKCLTYGSPAQRQAMIDEVMDEADGDVSSLYLMTKDQYANYVVQKMFDIADEPVRQRFTELLKPYLSSLRRFTYGKHFLSKVEKQIAATPTTTNTTTATTTAAASTGSQQDEQQESDLEQGTDESHD